MQPLLRPAQLTGLVLVVLAAGLCAVGFFSELDTRAAAVGAGIVGCAVLALTATRNRPLARAGLACAGLAVGVLASIAASGCVDCQGRCSPDMMFVIMCFLLVVWPLGLLLSFVAGARSFFSRVLPQAGCCTRCGYNLTGNTTGVCPECGTTVPVQRTDTDSVPPTHDPG
jgi:hypothetical protein